MERGSSKRALALEGPKLSESRILPASGETSPPVEEMRGNGSTERPAVSDGP